MNHRWLPCAAALVGSAFASHASAQSFTAHPDLVFATNVPTNHGTKSLKLDLYIPTSGVAPYPLIVWIHGGSWLSGTKAGGPASTFAPLGYAVASVEYRLSGEALWPAQIQDIKGAARWLRANAAAWNLDPERFGAWGASAGGHLTSCLGAMGDVGVVRLGEFTFDLEGNIGGNLDRSSRVQAAVDWFGCTDFFAAASCPSSLDHFAAGSPESLLLGQPIGNVPMHVVAVDPSAWISPDDPPFLVSHGTADMAIPYAEGLLLYERAKFRAGIDAHFIPVIDGLHGGTGFDTQTVVAFFDEHLMNLPATAVSVAVVGADPSEGGGAAGAFRVSRTGSVAAPLVVGVYVGGAATAGVDYAALGPLTVIPAGAGFVDLAPIPIDDALVEGDESIDLFVRPSAQYRVVPGAGPARVKIVDDDSAAGLPVVNVTTGDGVAGEGFGNPGHFVVTRVGSTANALNVHVRVGGRATNGVDDAAIPNVVALAPGAASVKVFVTPTDDTAFEPVEAVTLELEPGIDYAIGPQSASSVRIVDNDAGLTPPVNVFSEAIDVAEPAAALPAFVVSRMGSTAAALTVNLTSGGSATAGVDAAALPPSVTFAAGSAFAHVTLDPTDDAIVEGDERVALALAPGVGYRSGLSPAADVKIADDDAVVPSSASAALGVSPFVLGEPLTATVAGPAPGAPCVWFFGLDATFVPVPGGGMPLQVDVATAFVFGPVALDANGLATLAAVIPADAVVLDGVLVLLQAATLDAAGGIAMTPRVERRIARD